MAVYFTVEAAKHAIAEAVRAEARLAEIARTRRPTPTETVVARVAYHRAALAQKFLEGVR